ncbi:hypothetical protein FHQ08_04845 [Lactobacillus sp. CC-MHH1034]|uniref:hypothetical protein n=1 Tax=Agrilactobacillus fermenti TaxID=2586909 RepID=UPI001E2BBDD0|nr:hypothetical protein [Agrilactobacillus fermenti]MCD2256042.1 hypothetical protein [Agrilactobacillus fermenti]
MRKKTSNINRQKVMKWWWLLAASGVALYGLMRWFSTNQYIALIFWGYLIGEGYFYGIYV